jgi:uncharacterized membrane protein YphA (DoxX/SURF4 family)
MLGAGLSKFVAPSATGANATAPGAAFFDGLRATFVFNELATVEVMGAVLLLTGIAVPLVALGLTPIVVTIVGYSAA